MGSHQSGVRGKEVTSVGIESGAMEGDRRLVGGRRLSERGAGAPNIAGQGGTLAGVAVDRVPA